MDVETWRHGIEILNFYERIKRETENGIPGDLP
jgi:uncharacterized phage-associated protein